MPEYIIRKDALKAVRDAGSPANEIFYAGVVAGYNALKGIPAADVVSVVRCKDCRFYGIVQSMLCDMHHMATNNGDYCSYGVRKEDAHD